MDFRDSVMNHGFSKTLQESVSQSDRFLWLVSQVTRGMFGANRKKFMEGGVESDYADDSSLYYTQQSMFPPHRPDKDVSRLLNSSSVFYRLLLLN